MADDREVRCLSCGCGLFREIEHQRARPERKLLWFRRAARPEQLKLTCMACGKVRYEKPGTLQVTSYVTHNRVTGRTSRLF